MLLITRTRAPNAVLPALRPSATGVALALALLGYPVIAQAQQRPDDPLATAKPAEPTSSAAPATLDNQVSFAADGANYDDKNETVSVFGNVVIGAAINRSAPTS